MMNPRRVDPSETREVFDQYRKDAGEVPAAIGSVADAVPLFTKVEDYTTFFVEFAFIDNNIVIHFFHSKEVAERDEKWRLQYWLSTFPVVLSATAEDYFKATKPRIFAQYIEEMTSWYMKCNGFANRLAPEVYVRKFLERLDADLDAALTAMNAR
jgi:hypothetical protein